MGKVAKDKWDKVIEYLTHSDRDLEKVFQKNEVIIGIRV